MAAAAGAVKEAVKESLIGSTAPEPGLSLAAARTFEKHANTTLEDGRKVMTLEQFIDAIAPAGEDFHKIKREQFGILWMVADRTGKGYIDLKDWQVFDNLMSRPDAEYETAFRFFDVEGKGQVKFDDFVRIYSANKSDGIPFNFRSDWVNLYTGGNGSGPVLNYYEFSQLVKGLQGERTRQAFQHFDPKNTGFIEPEDFERLVNEIYGHKLSDHLLHHVRSLGNLSFGNKISYGNVRAFQNLVREMDMVEAIIRSAISKSTDGRITRTDFVNEAAKQTRFSLFTPMETDILFHFAGLDNSSGRLGLTDFARVLDPTWVNPLFNGEGSALKAVVGGDNSILQQTLEQVYNFALGSIAGAFGATIVYPIDLVKTRMQNQRKGVGQLLYKNSIDCAKKVIRNEGVRGLYSGLGPQLVGVAPEKAIKLTVNDFVRGWAKKPDGSIDLKWELIAGGTAGGCQVVFTNPLEIVKIRLQVQGEIARTVEGAPRRSAIWIVRNLGLVGLYKGASACLLRDVPFSAIYFPTYAHLKKDYFGEGPDKKLGILQLLTAGAIAGMPAAYFTTPCDVIKTRLQVEARAGQSSYNGLVHCAKTIWKEEGFKAFFKGGPARILRSSPQFGCTLAAYELLQSVIPKPGQGNEELKAAKAAAAPKADTGAPLGFLRSRNALKILLDMDPNFGKPKVPSDFKGVLGQKRAE